MKTESVHWPDAATWRKSFVFAAPTVALLLALYYHWFATRDRYFIFLYFHDMGPARFDTTPFGWVTVGRYWMTGFVAGGAVMLAYGAANFILGRIKKGYHAPGWWQVWLLCAIPLVIGIPAIVMTVNDPVLPLRYAAQVTVALLIALVLAVWFGDDAACQPARTILLMVDGVALTALLFVTNGIDDLFGGRPGRASVYLVVGLIGLVLLTIGSVIYTWRRQIRMPTAITLFTAYASIHYLFFPLYHHLFWSTDEGSWRDPGYFTYIPSADNYFIFMHSLPAQILIWGVMLLLAFGVTRLRIWLRNLRAPAAEPVA
ncbi:MAG: hypothetical protein AAGU78_00905 [Chloroflexota bacterium]